MSFENYGVESGYNQTAPGGDVAPLRQRGRPGRPRAVPSAVTRPTQPQPQTGVFAGVGAPPPPQSQFTGPGSIMDSHRRLNPPQQGLGALAGAGAAIAGQMGQKQAPAPADNSAWNTDGFAKPGYTAGSFGNAPAGWDATKWQNGDHQTPKYVAGRIMAEAGDLRDPANRAKVLANLQAAYPGTTDVNGKDKVNIPGVGVVDIFGNATGGEFRPQWLVDEGGAPAAAAPMAMPMGAPISPDVMSASISGNAQAMGGSDYTARLMAQIQAALSGQQV